MRRRSLAGFGLALLLACGCSHKTASNTVTGNQGSDVSRDDPIPARSWTPPPNQLPRDFVEAVTFVQAHGLADPRGGQFVKAKLLPYTFTNQAGNSIDTFGWLVTNSGKTPVLVAADGVVHTGYQSVAPTDLKAFVAQYKGSSFGGFRWDHFHNPELFAALLLVDGEPDLAQQLISQPSSFGQPHFVAISRDLLGALWEEAVNAHVTGDDTTALRVADRLVRDKDAYEKEATAVLGVDGVRRLNQQGAQWSGLGLEGAANSNTAFPFLGQVQALLEDSKRRLKEDRKPKFDPIQLKNLPQGERVKGLIEAFDQLSGPMIYSSGNPQPGDYPGFLAQEGDVAVEPLLDCMEKDRRLTRRVKYSSPVMIEWVADAAYQCFTTVTHRPPPTMGYGPARPQIADLRRWWAANKSLTPLERAFKTLQDDNASPSQWVMAASQMVYPSMGNGHTSQEPAAALRSKTHPSVTQLLTSRIEGLSRRAEPKNPGLAQMNLQYAANLCEILWQWDRQGALPALRAATDRWQALGNVQGFSGGSFVRLLEHREEMGEYAQVTKLYRKFLLALGSSRTSGIDPSVFTILVKQSVAPEFKGLARKIFLEPVLHPTQERNGFFGSSPYLAVNVANSPAIVLPEVREALLHLLRDRTVIGSVTNERGMIAMKVNGTNGTLGMSPTDKQIPSVGEVRPVRRCDFAMQDLTSLTGFPRIEPYWTTSDKDAAIEKVIHLLESHARDPWALIGNNSWPGFPSNRPNGAVPGVIRRGT